MAALATLRLKAKMGARARAGSPWIFSNELEMTPAAKALDRGVLVEVVGDDGMVLGVGAFNPQSLIAVRLFHWRTRKPVDGAFIHDRIAAALALRDALFAAPFYRLIHAEGDGLPGLIVDRFDDVLSVQANTAGIDRLQPLWLEALQTVLRPRAIVARNDTPARTLEGLALEKTVLTGAVDGPVTLREGACSFEADLLGGQKTGWYFDQRDWHAFVAKLARGKSMLDAFCYAGGCGVAALKAGAATCRFLDASEAALSLARRNVEINALSGASFARGDAMEVLDQWQSAERFDVVVVDPPPFVRARKDLEAGAKAYRKLARLAAGLTAPGGFLYLASCSHAISAERFALECAMGICRAGRGGRILASGGASADHPVHPMLPESAYLKALVYQLD